MIKSPFFHLIISTITSSMSVAVVYKTLSDIYGKCGKLQLINLISHIPSIIILWINIDLMYINPILEAMHFVLVVSTYVLILDIIQSKQEQD